jgi:hypothetical protein
VVGHTVLFLQQRARRTTGKANTMNDTTYPGAGNPRFMHGTPVFDVNGDKLGTVADADPQRNELIIQKGLIFHKDLPIPMSAIVRSDDDGIYLNVTKDDANNGIWATAGSARGVSTDTPYRADATQPAGDHDLDATERPNYPAGGSQYPADEPERPSANA